MGIGRGLRRRLATRRSGMTLIEVTIALAVVATIVMASAGSFTQSISAVKSARRTSEAGVFLRTVMEDLSAQPYANLLSFNGNRIYDGASSSSSNYSADVTTFLTSVDLIQVQAVATDLQSGKEVGRVTTLRTNR